jgi:hypothetical protein
MQSWAGVAGAAGVLGVILASCAGDGGARLGATGARETADDWRIFNAADTNADGFADLLWFSTSRNQIAVWLMQGAHVIAPGAPVPGPPGEGWVPITSADFNRDGFNDVIWNHPGRGTLAVWLLRGAQLLAAGPEIAGPPGDGWVVGNAGDTNGDGMADAVWYNAARHEAAVWLMHGSQLLAAGAPFPSPSGEGWVVTNVADTNADGFADIIWTNTATGEMTVSLLAGARLLAPGPVIPGPPGDGWTGITTNDFNRDGFSDLIWTNAGQGAMAVWLLRGSQLLAPGPIIAGPAGDGWAIAYGADTNGDGMADAIWQKAGTSLFSVWLMRGVHVLAPGPLLVGPGAGEHD